MRVVPPAADPEADLARLRRPTGPWLHLLDAAPADARQLGWMLAQGGVVVRILRGHCGRSAYGFLDEAGAALQLPGEPAEDWASLAASLTDLPWLPGIGHVLVVTRASLLLAAEPVAELGGLVRAVREAARARAEDGDPVPFHLVLQDDAVGLAALRCRLDAVGAKHAELAGWDAEEPTADPVAGTRSAFAAGAEPDEVDVAVGAAVSEVDGVLELRRAWEEFRGPAGGLVRVYAPVLTQARHGVEVAAVVARAAAVAGSACVVVPLLPARSPSTRAGRPRSPPPPRWSGRPPPSAPIPSSHRRPAGRRRAPPRLGPAPGAPREVRRPARGGSRDAAAAGAPAAGPAEPRERMRRVMRRGVPFELVAANLQWAFDTGPTVPDPVDAALVEHAAAGGRAAALFRSWVRDPDDGWVRVILAYVGPRGSIAAVEAERAAVVDVLRRSGAARCCVEVLAGSAATDVHRWLEARCLPLWPAAAAPPEPRPEVALTPESALTPGPGADDPDHADLVAALAAWAAGRAGVVGIVTAWTGADADRTLVVGVALDGRADPGPVRTEAAALAPAALVEPFAPSRGLDPTHLRLTRSSTRVWTRRADRPAREPPPTETAGALDRPAPPEVVSLGPPPTRDTADPRADLAIGGFTLVGIDRDVAVAKGSPVPDERDSSVIAWAAAEPTAIALLRGVATVAEEEIPVYCLCVTETADPDAARRDLAAAVAATGTPRAAAEAFAPAGVIPAFHLDLAVSSTRLWQAGS